MIKISYSVADVVRQSRADRSNYGEKKKLKLNMLTLSYICHTWMSKLDKQRLNQQGKQTNRNNKKFNREENREKIRLRRNLFNVYFYIKSKFDAVDRREVWRCLEEMKVPNRLVKTV